MARIGSSTACAVLHEGRRLVPDSDFPPHASTVSRRSTQLRHPSSSVRRPARIRRLSAPLLEDEAAARTQQHQEDEQELPVLYSRASARSTQPRGCSSLLLLLKREPRSPSHRLPGSGADCLQGSVLGSLDSDIKFRFSHLLLIFLISI